ncbi:MAG: hypothetical protein HZA88_18550 [Verrucomicrobia bacterium]|nr:hypothetical protein [Verrucomicrobiota bacterium]
MELNFDTRFLGVNRVVNQPRPQLTVKASKSDLSFPNSEALQNALRQVPDVREEEVARATHLVNSAQYPSPEITKKLASMLAKHLQDSQNQ